MRVRLLVVLALVLSACGSAVVGSADLESVPQLDLSEIPLADAPDPADRAGSSADHVECVYEMANGGWSDDFGDVPGEPDAEAALGAFLALGWFDLPKTGYSLVGKDTGRRLYAYSADGVPKVAVVVADSEAGVDLLVEGGWSVETFATCDPAEYDPSTDADRLAEVWTDSEGARVPTSIITSLQGSDHCEWESVTFLLYEEKQYIRDPKGAFAEGTPLVAPYQPDSTLPDDAVDTGYRSGDSELWLSPNEKVAYVVSPDRVEVWPAPGADRQVWCD